MTCYILKKWLDNWKLTASEGAKVLGVNKSKMSEWLSETSDRTTPKYILFHVEIFDFLTKEKGQKTIQKRLK